MFVKTKLGTDMKKLILFLVLLFPLFGFSQKYFSSRNEIVKYMGRDTSIITERDVDFEFRLDELTEIGLEKNRLFVRYGRNEIVFRLFDSRDNHEYRGEKIDTHDFAEIEIHELDLIPYIIIRYVERRGEVIKETKYYL